MAKSISIILVLGLFASSCASNEPKNALTCEAANNAYEEKLKAVKKLSDERAKNIEEGKREEGNTGAFIGRLIGTVLAGGNDPNAFLASESVLAGSDATQEVNMLKNELIKSRDLVRKTCK